MQQLGRKYFACSAPPPTTQALGWIGQNSTLSKHGHVVYQNKGNHECSKMVANIFLAYPPPPRPQGLGQ